MIKFDRNVHCLMGLPFDAVDMGAAVSILRAHAYEGKRCVMTTPNLNILVGTFADENFRESIIRGDLNVVDGMPLVWMARLLHIPLTERVAGSALFDALWKGGHSGRALSVFFFGGPDGVAERACQTINQSGGGLVCAGSLSPGFGSIEEMSQEETLSQINASGADFLVLSLGARKAQYWIDLNLRRLEVPLMSHLGAVVNFVAGTVIRAPVWMQQAGLEWLWRIKEEPSLWRRYLNDGKTLAHLLLTRILPYAIWLRFFHPPCSDKGGSVAFLPGNDLQMSRVVIVGDISKALPDSMRLAFQQAVELRHSVVVDLSSAGVLSPAFFGQLLLLKAALALRGSKLMIQGATDMHSRLFYWNAVEYLLRPF